MNDPRATRVEKPIECAASEGFSAWLAGAGGSVAITLYHTHRVALLGWDGRQVTILLRQFEKPMGLAASDGRLALATRHDVTIFANAPALAADYLENQRGRYDLLYLPRVTHHTGDINVHDVAFGRDALWLVNSRFSCLATVSAEHNFEPRWRPAFVTDTVPEDRCHLNGLALVDGRPGYVTALGMTDTAGGWRDRKTDGGAVLHVESNQAVLTGLAMPHSPRWQDGRLWVLNSGAGELCLVDPQAGRKEVVCALPGYLRGLCFAGGYALVGLSQIRERHIFGGTPLEGRFPQLRCGVALVEIGTGRLVGMFEFTGGCQELYDVQFLQGGARPMILNLQGDARQAFSSGENAWWLRPSSEIPPSEAP